MVYFPCLCSAFTPSQSCFVISRVSFETSSLMYISVPFRQLHLHKFSVCLYSWLILPQLYVSLKLLDPLLYAPFQISHSPILGSLRMFLQTILMSLPIFRFRISPSIRMLSLRDRPSRSYSFSRSSWLSYHTFSNSVRFFSFSNSIIFSSLFSLSS